MPRPLLRLLIESFALLALLTAVAAQGAGAGPLDRAMAAVLVLHGADDGRFLGSAFVWGDGKVAVTAAHVVGPAPEVLAQTQDGRQAQLRVLAADPVRDVALLSLPPGWGPGLPPGSAPDLGQPVWALGAPLGAAFTLTGGAVSARARQVDPAVPLRFLQHDAAVNPGSSGGPLVDAEGRLLGMNLRIADGSRLFAGLAYALAAPDLARIVEGLRAGTLRPVPRLGLTLRPLSRPLASALRTRPDGLLVDAVAPGSAAAAAGVLPGDILLSAGGIPLVGPGTLAFAAETAGDRLALALRRAGDDLTLALDLSPDPPPPTLAPTPAPPPRWPVTLADLGVRPEGTRLHLPSNARAAALGLADGDVMRAVNGTAVAPAALATLILTEPALLLLEGPAGTRHLLLDPWSPPSGPVGGANVLDPDVVLF